MKPYSLARIKSTFGFDRHPFASPAKDDLFRHAQLDHALDRLRYMAERKGICTLIAGPGLGKSTVLRAFIAELPKTAFAVAYLPETTCATVDLYRNIARAFDLVPAFRKSDLSAQIKARLGALVSRKVCPVLILDEAHLLSRTFFDELRILTNFVADSKNDLLLILAGQPQLAVSLRLGINEALAQRIVIRLKLEPMNRSQCADYLTLRLVAAGRNAPLFSPDAVEALFKASQGVPRRLDRTAELALLLALKAKTADIDADLIDKAVQALDP